MARRRNAACSDDNLFGFKLGTLKYFMETVTEIAPDAACTGPELEVSVLNKLHPLSPSVLKSNWEFSCHLGTKKKHCWGSAGLCWYSYNPQSKAGLLGHGSCLHTSGLQGCWAFLKNPARLRQQLRDLMIWWLKGMWRHSKASSWGFAL